MKAILVRVDDSIEVIELQNGEESIQEIVGGEIEPFDFGIDDEDVCAYCNKSGETQCKPNQLATFICGEFLYGGVKDKVLKRFEKRMLEEALEDDEKDRLRNEVVNELMDSLGETLYGNIVICAEDGDFPKRIIRKIMNTAKKYTDKCPTIEKPATVKPSEAQAPSEPQPEPSEEKVYTLWDAIHNK